ncbi:DUF2690 domain-containing protein [Streptomyces cinerochromogenes]|uniref:DUF2690 domain-containing protein n=1 Tax=Streptomyces cinerochromogenes TaxID=66422 RepID=A0ABW7BEK0_9ACTN
MSSSLRTWMVASVAAVSIVGSGTVSSDAVAAAGCRGNACDGRNPHTTRCDQDARNLGNPIRGEGGPAVRLRVSSRCSAAWVLIEKGDHAWKGRIDIRGGNSYHVNATPSRPAYSLMVGTSHAYRACKQDLSDGAWSCGGWH